MIIYPYTKSTGIFVDPSNGASFTGTSSINTGSENGAGGYGYGFVYHDMPLADNEALCVTVHDSATAAVS